ncbi:MAG TPA: DUF3999 domain-containing protein [Casimicrobiaceae bacterium]
MKRLLRALARSVLALAPLVALAQAPADFAMRQPLAVGGDKAFFRVELPDAVYDNAARPDLGDLRVFNGDAAAVPYAFLPPPSPQRVDTGGRPLAIFPLTVDTTRPDAGDLSISLRRGATATTVDIRTRAGAPVSGSRVVGYLLDASPDADPLVALTLRWRSTANVTTRARVDASDDLAAWRTLVASAPLVMLEYDGRRLSRDRIEFAPTTARYLRVTWLTPEAPELASVVGHIGDRLVDAPRRVRKAAGVPDASSPGAFTFDLGAALPVDRVTLELPDINTVAPVSWQARVTPQEPWRSVGDSIVYRLRRDGGEVVNAEHPIAPAASRYFRARIDPKSGGVGATPPTLAAGWYAREIVFAARGNGPFELAYGSRSVTPAALAIETLVPGYAARKPLPDNVGVAQVSAAPTSASRTAMREPLDFKRWLLWGSLVAAALLLGFMALRLAQQMRDGDGAPKANRDG